MTSSELVNDFVAWYLENNPVQATLLGAEGYDRTLGDLSEAGFLAREGKSRRWLERLARTPQEEGFEEEIDRELVVSTLRGALAYEDWPTWRRDPAVYVGTVFGSMFSPFLQRLAPEAELVEAAG
ncbi:DUF885 domain-containing protein, partial [Streptosporangium algeriense]